MKLKKNSDKPPSGGATHKIPAKPTPQPDKLDEKVKVAIPV